MQRPESDSLEERMRVLKLHYLEQLQERTALLDDLLAHCDNNSLTAEDRAELKMQAHKLAGTGTTYGFADISEAGRSLEDDMIDYPDAEASFFAGRTRLLRAACIAALKERENLDGTAMDAATEASPLSAGLPLLLVVDDDDSVIRLLKELFRDDARLLTAADSAEAMALMAQHKPDLVLLDDKMPGAVSGLTLLENLQATPEFKAIPVIMLTASDTPEDVMRGLMAGAVDYITKPFDPAGTAAKLRGRLKRRHRAVLIADDDEAVRQLLEHKFRAAGCKVAVAADGAEAWAQLQQQPFALAVLDRMMPGHDGMTLLRMMKENAALAALPVVFLTARHYGADVLEGLDTGAADYITKLFNPDEVVARCLRFITGREA